MPRTKKYSSKKLRHKKQNKFFFVFAAILIIVLTGLVLYSLKIFEPRVEPIRFDIQDECGQILGNLIHNIQNDGGCKVKCADNCEIRGMEFHNYSFTFQEASCHTCECYCR
jgi:hypothetical protein